MRRMITFCPACHARGNMPATVMADDLSRNEASRFNGVRICSGCISHEASSGEFWKPTIGQLQRVRALQAQRLTA
jgi:hypothetical protein